MNSLDELKESYRIPAAWRDLDLPGQPGKCVSSPFREDTHPSFSIFKDGTRFCDHGTGQNGSVIDFVAIALDSNISSAAQWIRQRLGIEEHHPAASNAGPPKSHMPDLRMGTVEELNRLSKLRGFSLEGICLAQQLGLLRFCEFASRPAWAVTDESRRLVELRRLDGQPWPEYRQLAERKAHCKGSGKNVPIGLSNSDGSEKCVLVEGAPDLVAACHFLIAEGKSDSVTPLAMLGGASALASQAACRLSGKHVRLLPHLDEAGRRAGAGWARTLHRAGAAVDAFDLTGLVLSNGSKGKDLADVCHIDPDCFEKHRKFSHILP